MIIKHILQYGPPFGLVEIHEVACPSSAPHRWRSFPVKAFRWLRRYEI